MALTLQQRDINLTQLAELRGLSVAAFDHATQYLGSDFAKAIASASSYTEYSNQIAQNMLLYHGKVDVVVADINIFNYLDGIIGKQHSALVQPVRRHDLFPPAPYRMACRDAKLCDAMTAALPHAHDWPEFQDIVKRWQPAFAEPLDEVLIGGNTHPVGQ
jgi:polar amino acid transport system substrate-binding protein